VAATLRTILNASAASFGFIDGICAMGVNLDAAVPMLGEPVPPLPTTVTPLLPIFAEAGRLMRAGPYGGKIPAIRHLRNAIPGIGLKDAKDIVDAFIPTGWSLKQDPPPY
jgi:hypothetical protein